MKFIVSSSELLARLQSIGKVIDPKSTFPILNNFLFEIKNTNLTLTASDKATTLISTITLQEGNDSGKIAVPSKILLDILRELPEQPLTFDIEEKELTIKIISNNGEYSIVGQDANEYPVIKELEKENVKSASLPTDAFQTGIEKTLFATAEDEYRPVMNGIYLDINKNNIIFVASDAHKLVRYRRDDINSELNSSFILPKKPASLIKDLLSKEINEVKIDFNDRYAHIILPDYKIICLLIEGNYPNYNSVIPESNPYKLIIDRVEFYNALKRVALFSNQSSLLVKLEIKKTEVIISAQDIDFSISAVEKLKCQYKGEEIQIGFKSTFIRDILQNIDSTEIELELTDANRAGIFSPTNKEDESQDLLMLLMPMMINTPDIVEN